MIQNTVPKKSFESALIASVFNTLSEMGVYPNLEESFLKFNITQYVYLIQDIKTNTLINLYIFI